jgi:hypothetical protein
MIPPALAMRRLRQFLRLPPADRRLLATAALLQAAIRVGLNLTPYRRVRAVVDRLTSPSPRNPSAPPASPERIAWAVARTASVIPRTSCLTQALAAKVLLERRGHRARVRVGVNRTEGAALLLAHAWVECDGRVVLGGTDLGRYTPLSGLEGEGR